MTKLLPRREPNNGRNGNCAGLKVWGNWNDFKCWRKKQRGGTMNALCERSLQQPSRTATTKSPIIRSNDYLSAPVCGNSRSRLGQSMQRCRDERIVRIVWKLARMVKLEKITRERYQQQFLEGSVRNGQNKHLILTNGEMKEITTSVEILTTTREFGVTPPTKTKDGKTAMCQYAKVKLA